MNIDSALSLAYDDIIDTHTPTIGILKPKPSEYLLSTMKSDGWCPFRLACLSSSTSSGALSYLRTVPNLAILKQDHQQCTSDSCCVDNLQNYQVQHVRTCAQDSCSLIAIPLQELISIYEDDIPVLACTLTASDDMLVKVIPASKCSGYTAISHVWSDGLGNDQGNAIPQCQLRQLINDVRMTQNKLPAQDSSLPEDAVSEDWNTPVKLWLDTLCIPIAGDENRSVRKQAISHIDLTFQAAEAVLVVDKGLRQLRPDGLDPLQLACHCFTAKWQSRCWTLPEREAAHRLFIQFHDRALSLDELQILTSFESQQNLHNQEQNLSLPIPGSTGCEEYLRSTQTIETEPVDTSSTNDMDRRSSHSIDLQANRLSKELQRLQSRQWRDLISSFTDSMHGHEHYSRAESTEKTLEPFRDSSRENFRRSWNAMLRRTTSRKEDVIAVLGLLLYVTIGDVIRLPEDLRMKAVLNAEARIPSSFLFSPGDKMKEPKNRWVPMYLEGELIGDLHTGMKTYDEGKMVGPLSAYNHATYTFTINQWSYSFCLQTNEGLAVEVTMATEHELNGVVGRECCLILPPNLTLRNWTAPLLVTAALVVTKQKREKNVLVSWECLAELKCLESPNPLLMAVEGEQLEEDFRLFVECGQFLAHETAC